MEQVFKTIGIVRSDLRTIQDAPCQGSHSLQEATLEIFPEFCLGLAGMENHSRLLVLYWLHCADREVLRVYPGGNRDKEMIGVFTNRSPLRPNPVGISVVDILEVDISTVRVRGLDAIDGTPVIDLKAARDSSD